MTPHTQPRKKRNSSRVNLLISFIFHAALVLTMLYFAARQGWLGHQMQKISVEMVKEKKPEKPKEPEKAKVEPPKVIEKPKPLEAPKPVESTKAPPPSTAPPTVAPPAAELPAFVFEGGKAVISSSDPVEIYKSALESSFRAKWNRPENMNDDSYVADVDVAVQSDGRISDPVWQKGSGNTTWDDSVRAVIAVVTNMDRPPPTNFPPRVIIRFDVQEETQPVLP